MYNSFSFIFKLTDSLILIESWDDFLLIISASTPYVFFLKVSSVSLYLESFNIYSNKSIDFSFLSLDFAREYAFW